MADANTERPKHQTSAKEHVDIIRTLFKKIVDDTVSGLDRQHELGLSALKDIALANEIADRDDVTQQSAEKIGELTRLCNLLVQQFQRADAQTCHLEFLNGWQKSTSPDGVYGVRRLLDLSQDLVQAHVDDVVMKELIATDVDYDTAPEVMAAHVTVWEARMYVPHDLTAAGLRAYVDASAGVSR